MSLLNTPKRYGSLAIGLHWATLGLLVAVYLCVELRGYFPKGSDAREALEAWHFDDTLQRMLPRWTRARARA